MRYLLSCLLFAVIAASCASLPKNSANATRQIKCGPGPEDIVLDSTNSSPRLLISCSARREGEGDVANIMEYRFDGQEAKHLSRIGEPAGFVFNPHGIDITTYNGKTYLYVVNHRDDLKQHFIVVYTVEADKLVFEKQLTSAFLVSPNDCAAGPNGSVYVTNDSGKRDAFGEKLFKLKRANVVMFDSLGNCSVVAEKLAYANGLIVINDTVDIPTMNINAESKTDTLTTVDFKIVNGDTIAIPTTDVTFRVRTDNVITNVPTGFSTLYVSTVQQKALFAYIINTDGTLDYNRINIAPFYGYDNITKSGDELIIVAHPKPLKFLAHMKNAKKPSPGITYAVNYKTLASRVVFADDGKRISCNSTGLIYKNKLYIAQVFEPFILEVDLK